MPYRYFIRLSYDGRLFHGWQKQGNAHTVQAELEDALKLFTRNSSGIVGCGRTDTGVSALNYYCHFDTHEKYTNAQLHHLADRLNKILPLSIAIQAIIPVQPGAHARFSAVSRTYIYQVLKVKDPFKIHSSYFYRYPLKMELMNSGGRILKSYSDFTSFSKKGTQVRTNICTISQAEWIETEKLYIFRITADRFLRNMVRAIVGTLMDLGRGKIILNDLTAIIESKDRGQAGNSVPANGLYLEDVKYPDTLFAEEPVAFSNESLYTSARTEWIASKENKLFDQETFE